jgi:hypothetical protein
MAWLFSRESRHLSNAKVSVTGAPILPAALTVAEGHQQPSLIGLPGADMTEDNLHQFAGQKQGEVWLPWDTTANSETNEQSPVGGKFVPFFIRCSVRGNDRATREVSSVLPAYTILRASQNWCSWCLPPQQRQRVGPIGRDGRTDFLFHDPVGHKYDRI